ncbi:MAG TPA: hypothetical protein VGR08_13000, partial [Thermomicrobiales bacterium]|nr:hypothetical protein [Thermomicrobiales bacterium]
TISFAIVDVVWRTLTVDEFANVPAPIRRVGRAFFRTVLVPVGGALAPAWNAPGNARRWARGKLTALR